ncbi:MAG: hypothetical protein JXA66_03975 [Oligoflexia bacterium]|nr:hypothetical protein [Oligoflexia bacterium]
MISVQLDKVLADPSRIKKRLKIKTSREDAILDRVYAEAVNVLNPEYVYFRCSGAEGVKERLCAGSGDISKLLSGVVECFVVICTVGSGYAGLQDAYKKAGDMVSSMYLDLVCSDTAENLAEYSSGLIFNRFFDVENHAKTRRFSPGYGDFGLGEQRYIFSLFDDRELGVSLTESMIMCPEKSVSYVFGVLEK